MGADGRVNQAVTVPLLGERFAASNSFIHRVETGCREVNQGFSHDGSDSRFFSFGGDDVFKKIHVVETRGPRFDHFDKSEPGGNGHVLRGHHACLCRENMFVQPRVEWKVIGIPAQHGHRHVGMRVDKPGHHDHAFCIKIFGIGDLNFTFTDLFDLIIFYPDRTIFDQLHAFVHGDDVSVKYNCRCHILVFVPKLVIFPVSRDD